MIRINGTDRESQSAIPSSQNIGMAHVNANKKFYEPQRGNDFELVIPGLNGLVDPVTGVTYDNAEEIIRLAVARTPIPHFSIEPITQRRGNSVMKYAGTPSFDAGEMTIRDWIGNNTVNILYAWQNLAYNVNTDKTGLLEDYKFDAYLIELSPDKQVVRQWIMEGMWVSAVSEEPFDNQANQAERLMTVTFQYDRGRLINN